MIDNETTNDAPETSIHYECAICGQEFDTRAGAKACEARGREKTLRSTGEMVRVRDAWGGNVLAEVVDIFLEGHFVSYKLEPPVEIGRWTIGATHSYDDSWQLAREADFEKE